MGMNQDGGQICDVLSWASVVIVVLQMEIHWTFDCMDDVFWRLPMANNDRGFF